MVISAAMVQQKSVPRMLIDTARITLPKILKASGYQTAIIGKWHLGFGIPGTPGWDDLKGPDYNRELRPGPLETGFDYFFGIPHVGQKPHIFIENHHVVGLSGKDSMQIVLDERWLYRRSYLERIGVPAHQFKGNESARYKHENLAVKLTEKAVEYIENQESEPFCLYFAHRNIHSPRIPDPRFIGGSEIGIYGDFIDEFDWSVGEILDALGQKPKQQIRESVVVDASSGLFGIREGPWKLIAGQGGGGTHYYYEQDYIRLQPHKWNYPEDPENPPAQLYNLEEDSGETNNLYYSHPEVVIRLRAKLREIQYNGRIR